MKIRTITEDIKHLMEITDFYDLSKQIMHQMILIIKQHFQAQNKTMPDAFWNDFIEEFDLNDLMDRISVVYEKHLTHEDIKQLIAFYESPIGRKIIKVQPLITLENMTIGRDWGERASDNFIKKLRSQGYDI